MAAETPARQPQRGLTFEDVWAMFQETGKRFQETDRLIKEAQKETDRRIQETDRRIQETDRQMKETDQRIQETDRQIQETSRQMKETDRQIQALNEQMGGLHNSFGELAEHLVTPSIAEKFNALGYHFDAIAPGGKKILGQNGKTLTQIDLLLENGEYSVAVEIKSRPTEKDIEHHERRLKILRQHMDKHHDSRVIRGALAGAVFPEIVKEAAAEAGLYVIVQSGDTVKIEMPEGFKPTTW
jgi:hypothetical protein